jgi:hypothetical protein
VKPLTFSNNIGDASTIAKKGVAASSIVATSPESKERIKAAHLIRLARLGSEESVLTATGVVLTGEGVKESVPESLRCWRRRQTCRRRS